MKKIKFLNYLVIVLLLINSNWLVQHFNFSIKVINDEALRKTFGHVIFKHYNLFVQVCFDFIYLVGVFFVQRGLYNIIKKGVFNNKSNSLFRKGGLLFLISGFSTFIINAIIPLFKFNGLNFFNMFFGNDFLVFILGLSLYLVADIIQDGSLLKQENDLTI